MACVTQTDGTFFKKERTWGRFELRSASQLFCHSEEGETKPADSLSMTFLLLSLKFLSEVRGVLKGFIGRAPSDSSLEPVSPMSLTRVADDSLLIVLGKLFLLLWLLHFVQTSQYNFSLEGNASAAYWLRQLLRHWDRRSWPVLFTVPLANRTPFSMRLPSEELIRDIFWRYLRQTWRCLNGASSPNILYERRGKAWAW